MEKLRNYNIDLTSSFALKRRLINDFCKLAMAKNEYNKIKSNSAQDKNILDAFLKSLGHDYLKIFTKNFLIKEDLYGSWYLNYWSKTTYYKKLNYVVNLFLRYISDVN